MSGVNEIVPVSYLDSRTHESPISLQTPQRAFRTTDEPSRTANDSSVLVGSAWGVSEVAVWDRALTRAEIEAVSAYLLRTLAEGRDAPFSASMCPGGVGSSRDADAPFLSTSGTCYFRELPGADCSVGTERGWVRRGERV